jgi:hypothetical protein
LRDPDASGTNKRTETFDEIELSVGVLFGDDEA